MYLTRQILVHIQSANSQAGWARLMEKCSIPSLAQEKAKSKPVIGQTKEGESCEKE